MDDFEGENPFAEDENAAAPTASAPDALSSPQEPEVPSPVAQAVQQSPPAPPPPLLSPVSPRKQNQSQFKDEYCCARDRDLHSGDDLEILVNTPLFPVLQHMYSVIA